MSTGEHKTIRVVTGEGVAVEAASLDSGVAGLALVGTPDGGLWRLIHVASGRIVSRSAHHPDPEILRKLAHRLAALADWTQRDIHVPGPLLRQEIEAAVGQLGLTTEEGAHAGAAATPATAPGPHLPSPSPSASRHGPDPAMAPPANQVVELQDRLRGAERERALLRRILRRVHTSVPPGTFAEAIRDLDSEERALLRALITDGASDSTAVVQPLPRGGGDEPSHPSKARRSGSGSGAAAG